MMGEVTHSEGEETDHEQKPWSKKIKRFLFSHFMDATGEDFDEKRQK